MTMLANDMASLYNVDPQQAYEKPAISPSQGREGPFESMALSLPNKPSKRLHGAMDWSKTGRN